MHEFRLDTIGPAGDCAVLRATGEVDVHAAPMLRERLRELAVGGAVHLIVDLSQVDFLDSTGQGVLVGGLRRLRENDGSLALVVKTPGMFRITGLTKALAAWPSVADAVTADPHWRKTAESQAGSVHEWCRRHGLSLRLTGAPPATGTLPGTLRESFPAGRWIRSESFVYPLSRGRSGPPGRGSREMTQYLIIIDAHAMDHIPGEDMPAVADAAHAVVQEAIDAGVYVSAGGLEDQPASIVATDGTVTEGTYPQAIGGFTLVDVPAREEALEWAAKFAAACRCPQEVREIGFDPQLDAMLRQAGSRR